MIVYTIGHSNYTLENFVRRIREYHIDCIVDIRGTPYSKYNIQYNKERVGHLLKHDHIQYIYMGKEFAAQRTNLLLYKKEGYADFEKVLEDMDFLSGIKRLEVGIQKGYHIALMGAKQNPVECHRFALVGRGLVNHGVEVRHILHDGGWATQKQLESQLIDYYHVGSVQIPLNMMTGEVMDVEEILNDCYRKANKDIGFRVEHLKS